MSRAETAIETDFSGLDAYFKDVITPTLGLLEGRRKRQYFISKIVFAILFLGVMPLCIYLFWKYQVGEAGVFGSTILTIVFFMFGTIISGGIAGLATKNVKSDAKKTLMSGIADHFEWSYEAHPVKPPVIKFLKDNKVFVTMNSEKYEDGLSGEALRHKFTITEADMQSNVEVNDKPTFSFRGIVLSIDFPEQIFGTTILRLKHRNYKWRNLKGFKEIGFASPEFSKKYEVYGTDPTESYYLFSPDVMVTLMDVAIAFGGTLIACVYWNGTLNLMITGKDRYEIKTSAVAYANEKQFGKMKQDISSIYDVIEKVEYYLTHRDPRNFKS